MIPRNRGSPYVVVCQSKQVGEPPELKFFQQNFGGRLKKDERPSTSATRHRWSLTVNKQPGLLHLLSAVAVCGIVKREQAALALAFMLRNPHMRTEFRDCITRSKKQYADVTIDSRRITDAYMAGLFAAEGSVGIYRHHRDDRWVPKTTIAQLCCPRLLEAIRETLGFGSVSRGYLHISPRQMEKFFERIRPHMIGQKVPQIELALEFQGYTIKNGRKRTAEHKSAAEKMAKRLKEMKKT